MADPNSSDLTMPLRDAMELYAWYGFMGRKPMTVNRFLSKNLSSSPRLQAAQAVLRAFIASDPNDIPGDD